MKPVKPLDSVSLYDSEYYGSDEQGSRLSPVFNRLLYRLDYYKAASVLKKVPLKPRSLIFDVGAGDGKFLYFMKQAGHTVFGTTASQISQKAARKNFSLELDFTTSITETLGEKQCDMLTYWHVFEHLENVSSHSDHWRNLVKPGGYLVLEVPNISSLGAKLNYASWLGSDDDHHPNHQTPEQIRSLLVWSGFRVFGENTFSLKFSYVFLWSALLGFLFPKKYKFDDIMSLLKNPLASLRESPLVTLNGYLSLIYLAPVIFLFLIWGNITQQGEVYRVYAQKI